MPVDPFFALALQLFPEVSGIISGAGAITGGGGNVLTAVNKIFGLPGVSTRAEAGRLFMFVRQSLQAGEQATLGNQSPGDVLQRAPKNPVLFGPDPGALVAEYRVVLEWTDPLTGQRRTSAVEVVSEGPLTSAEATAAAALELLAEYEVSPEDVGGIAPQLVVVQSIIRVG